VIFKAGNAAGSVLHACLRLLLYLILTVRMVAIQAAIEDRNGDVADLALYHSFETKGMKREDIASLLPVGLVILVREPFFKLGATGGHPTIRVDSPTDVRFLTHSDLMLRDIPESWKPRVGMTAEDYKAAGNAAYNKDHFEAAIRVFTFGLSIDPSASLLRLNRSWCHLKLGNPYCALSDARVVSEDQNLSLESRNKARYRMALAYYAMDRFSDALGLVDDGVSLKSFPEDFSQLRKKLLLRVKEQMHGEYDWLALDKQVRRKYDEVIDVADYVGPIAIARMPTKGGNRGVITTRPVVAGELLVSTLLQVVAIILISSAGTKKNTVSRKTLCICIAFRIPTGPAQVSSRRAHDGNGENIP
jgi:tetratricopeptide (TPR) repeat protein